MVWPDCATDMGSHEQSANSSKTGQSLNQGHNIGTYTGKKQTNPNWLIFIKLKIKFKHVDFYII